MADTEQLQAAYLKLREKKQARKDLQQTFADELEHDARYQEVKEKIKELREEKKRLEEECYARALADAQRLEELKEDVKTHEELISDLAISLLMDKQTVAVTDEYKNKYDPIYIVRFKKIGEVAKPARSEV